MRLLAKKSLERQPPRIRSQLLKTQQRTSSSLEECNKSTQEIKKHVDTAEQVLKCAKHDNTPSLCHMNAAAPTESKKRCSKYEQIDIGYPQRIHEGAIKAQSRPLRITSMPQSPGSKSSNSNQINLSYVEQLSNGKLKAQANESSLCPTPDIQA